MDMFLKLINSSLKESIFLKNLSLFIPYFNSIKFINSLVGFGGHLLIFFNHSSSLYLGSNSITDIQLLSALPDSPLDQFKAVNAALASAKVDNV